MLISLSLLLPIVFSLLIPLAGFAADAVQTRIRRSLSISAPAAVLPAIVLAIFGAGSHLKLDWLLFGSTLAVDDVARGLVLISALLYGAALMSISWTKLRDTEPVSGALSGFLLVSYAGNIGVYLAADVVTFYLCFALMSFSAVGLVVHYRTSQAYRAANIYLVMTVISETALLGGLLLTVHAGGMLLADAPEAVLEFQHTWLILTLLLIGFGIKAGTVPLHVWLPLAHPAAPPAASAVLSGAMVKAGMVGFLRYFPLQNPSAPDHTIEIFGWVLMVLSLVGAFAAVIVGVLQHDAKVVLAYSTISQMGFIGALIAAGLINSELAQDTIDAAVLYAVHHGLAKGALFLGVPVIKHYGRGLASIVVTVGMCGAGLAVAGAPATSGGVGKYVAKEAIEGLSLGGVSLEYVLPLVATGSALLLLRFVWVVLDGERQWHNVLDGELFAWLGVCVAGLVVPWLVAAYWSPLGLPDWTDPQTIWDSTWPIGLGLLIGAGFWFATNYGWLKFGQREHESVPAGDLVVIEEHLTQRLVVRGSDQLDKVHVFSTKLITGCSTLAAGVAQRLQNSVDRIETVLRPWPRFGTTAVLFLTLVLVLSAVVVGG